MSRAVPQTSATRAASWTRGEVARTYGLDYEDYSWGVPDLLPNYGGEWCDATHPDGPVCTRPVGHGGRHAAANGDAVIIAVWW